MKVTPESIARIAGANFTAESVIKLFGFMEAQCDALGANTTAFSFDFQKPEDIVQPGDLIPVLTLSLRPATPNAPKPEDIVDLHIAPSLDLLAPRFDPLDPAQVEALLGKPGVVAQVYLATAAGVQSWFLTWRQGTMSLQPGPEPLARATAALFIHLYEHGIDCGLARDLACSYFDPRIGRE